MTEWVYGVIFRQDDWVTIYGIFPTEETAKAFHDKNADKLGSMYMYIERYPLSPTEVMNDYLADPLIIPLHIPSTPGGCDCCRPPFP